MVCFSIEQPKEDMLRIRPILMGILFMQILHWHHQLSTFANGDVAMNCGSVGKLTAVDGREWIGESASECMSGKSGSSDVDQTSFRGVDPVPYKTSRISATEFGYTFRLNPGQKFIRLHFYPASYRGFEKSVDYFTVKAGPFTLLRDYSASHAADTMGVKYIVKEFCLNVEENKLLDIKFSPSQNSKLKNKAHAFVNGIEIISMPTGLYYTPEREIGARIVGLSHRFYSIDNSSALEVVQRFNVGGSSITSVEDFGMFRQWNEDTNYLLEPRAHRVNHLALKIKYTNMPAFVAPPKIFQTSWKSGSCRGVRQTYNFRWKVPVDLGFGYLVRLHFCDLSSVAADSEGKEFVILINNQIAESKADVIRWSGGPGIPVYRDYVMILKGDMDGSKSDLFIGLQSVDDSIFQLLNGLEIIKLSDLKNTLAAPNLVFPKRIPTSWNLKIEKLSLAFGKSNVIGMAMTVLVILLSIVTYNLRKIWEENFHDGKYEESASVEPSCHCFSLAEIKFATENFNDAFIIGRGGFGKVYKGFIPGIAETVAMKRLNPNSKQGAREFWTEIETLSKLRHLHLVSLIGYCNECSEMILVYEYMPSGTLADNLYKFARKEEARAPLTWEQRLRICIGAARGLEYLHTGSEYGVIHRDVKDTNILLDENFIAKISDFGLSKLEKITHSKSYVSTKVKGTFGYLDPDYFATHRLTRKSDVYSFGVVMLVVLSGRPALDTSIPGEPQSLLSCFRECMAEGDFSRIIDPCLQGEISSNRITEFVKIVENCFQQTPKRRHTMTQVAAGLEQALEQYGMEGNTQSFRLLFEAPAHEESVISPPEERNTSVSTQNLASPTRRKDVQLSGKGSTPIPKPFWGFPWKALKRRGKKQEAESSLIEAAGELSLYSYQTLANATDYFHAKNKIGHGGFGPVYEGKLLDGREIAVKRLSNSSRRGMNEIMNEVRVTSKLQHRNLIRLLGCCVEKEETMLVYEYMPNKSLDAHIFDSQKQDLLNWNRRAVIIEGIGRGLLYLHRNSRLRIIHRNLKASNILLDEELNPRISDFGVARILEGNQDEVNTSRIVGTCGYMAPEYAMHGTFSEKTDVYSFGVLLLEIVSGRRYASFYQDEENLSLLEYARKLWNENKAVKLMDIGVRLDPLITEMEILRYVQVGLLCVQDSANDRPNMSDVLLMLNSEIGDLPLPKLRGYAARLSHPYTTTQCSPQCGHSVNDVSLTDVQGR